MPKMISTDFPMHRRVATWLAMVPLIFYSAHGTLSVFYTGNGALNVAGGGIINTADPDDVIGTRIAGRLVSAIVLVLLFPMARRFYRLVARNKLLGTMVVLAVASCFWSQAPVATFEKGLFLALTTCFGLYLTEEYTPTEIMRLLIFAGSIAIVFSIFLAISIPQIGVFHGTAESAAGWQGIFSHKNVLGFAMVNLLAPALFLQAHSWAAKLFRAAYLGGSLFLIVMSRSRGAWLVCASLLVFAALMKIGRRFAARDRVALYACLGLIVVLLAMATITNLRPILELLGKDPTLTGRTTIWAAIFNSISKRPLQGYGFCAFWLGIKGESANVNLAVRWAALNYAENGVLELGLELGLIGVGLFAAIYLQAYSRLRRVFSVAKENIELFWYASVLFLIFVTNIESGLIANPDSLEWLLFVVAVVGIGNKYREVSQRTVPLYEHRIRLVALSSERTPYFVGAK